MDPLSIVIFILKILGVFVVIGSIITVHEFGHFIAARMAGVEVHRFAIGLGPPIPGLTFRGKETEYAICWIPFGGYVKFRGQTDTPEIEITDNDPRSYQVKSVGWRMTIMTAGVAMNLVYGFFLYIAANLVGVPFNPAVIGASFPKQPAWEAGIREGDKLISINGVLRDDFDDIRRQVTLTDPRAETVVFVMERDGKRIDFDVRPVKESGKLQPQIGVIPSTGLRVLEHQRRAAPDSEQKLRSETPAGRMAPAPKFGDVIVAVDGAPVANYHEFNRKMFENREKPATLTFERKPKKEGQTPERYDGVVEPAFVRTLGLVAEIGKIEAVRKDSPAARATLVENGKPSPIQAGDIIKKIDGIEDFDPLKLPDLIAAKAAKGEPVEIVLIREGRQSEEIRVKTVPENIPPWNDFAEGWIYRDKDDKHPFSVPSLGLAYQVRNRIRKVDPEGPSAKANPPLQVGDRIVTVEYGYEGEKKVETFALDVEANWTQAFWNLQDPWIGGKVIVTVQRGEGAATVKSTVD
ncbi:MAG TPA: RIP metalloprotease RseP, partial [Planctomycetia bacterium]|nr:RIP metalloprotease RseP [Planctomycetia bacterium]